MTISLTKDQFDEIVRPSFLEKRVDMGGKRYLVDENGFVVASSDRVIEGENMGESTISPLGYPAISSSASA